MFEYEVKVRLRGMNEVKEVERKLLDLGFKYVESRYEEDYYVDLTSCTNVGKDSVLRIRKVASEDGVVRGELTFKGPRLSKEVKLREEVNVYINKPELFVDIFSKLGFKLLILKKSRKVYSRNTEKVYIDHVYGLGYFLEYELINPKDLNTFKYMFNKLVKELRLSSHKPIIKSYLELMLEGGPHESNSADD
ncbi:MAG: class IV adenylate cyclase [Thermoprotei archaeon]|nr:MAG: class IV adenylate cyclase [Thermoprotei archaeon]